MMNHEVVRVVFGIKWEQSIPLIQLLTIFGIGRMVIIPVVPKNISAANEHQLTCVLFQKN
jgi:hypothetical protein